MLLRRLAEGAAIALVSDAGTPLISDPGYKLVRAAQDAGHTVTALAGRVGGAGGPGRRRPADRSVLVRRLSAAEGGRAARPHRRARPHPGDAGAVRDRPAPCRDARRPRRRTGRTARGSAVPRTHQAARGDPARRSCDAGARLTRRATAARRDRSGHRAAAGAASRSSAAETETHAAPGAWRAFRSKTPSAKSPTPPACRGARFISARWR